MRTLLFIILTLAYFTTQAQNYEIVLATDFDGLVTEGSKQELIKFIREGKPVRVGWQLDFNEDKEPDFDHWIEATFITILGEEVFTQIDPIYAQGPNIEIPQLQIYPNNTQWTAVLGTNGKLLNRFILNGQKKPELIFDESLGLTKEQFEIEKKKAEESWLKMNAVDTWQVATFWSIMK